VVAVLAGVEDGGQGAEGGVGEDAVHGGLAAGLVPDDGDVEGGQQPGFERGRELGDDVAGVGDLVEDGRVCRAGSGGLEGG
jgi:hypothetical protein